MSSFVARFIGAACSVGATTALLSNYRSEKTISERVASIGSSFFNFICTRLSPTLRNPSVNFTSEETKKVERFVSPFLFQVTGEGIEKEVYLLGTDHSLELDRYPAEAIALIKSCDLLVSEFRVEPFFLSGDPRSYYKKNCVKNATTIFNKMLVGDEEWLKRHFIKLLGQEIDLGDLISILKQKAHEIKQDQDIWLDLLTHEEKVKIQKHLGTHFDGIAIEDLNPFLVRLLLASEYSSRRICYDCSDSSMVKWFKDQNRDVIELDSDKTVLLANLDNFPQAILDYSLDSTLQQVRRWIVVAVDQNDPPPSEIDPEKFGGLKTAYELETHLHNLSGFDFETMFLGTNELSSAVAYRNRKWMPKILAALEQNRKTGIICGAGHLHGETGLVPSLRKAGYHVEHVKTYKERE